MLCDGPANRFVPDAYRFTESAATAEVACPSSAAPVRALLRARDGNDNLLKPDAWRAWGKGFTRKGEVFVCDNGDDARVQRGASQTVVLNQREPKPIAAVAWSKAQNVGPGGRNDYALYLDLIYMDGTPLWGQTAPFECGTHDWQKRTVTVIPSKPIKSVTIHGIFRNKTGTAWFDDFSFATLERSDTMTVFDSVAVIREAHPTLPTADPLVMSAGDGLKISVDRNTGAVIGDGNAVGGFYWRDVAAESDFRQPRAQVKEVFHPLKTDARPRLGRVRALFVHHIRRKSVHAGNDAVNGAQFVLAVATFLVVPRRMTIVTENEFRADSPDFTRRAGRLHVGQIAEERYGALEPFRRHGILRTLLFEFQHVQDLIPAGQQPAQSIRHGEGHPLPGAMV